MLLEVQNETTTQNKSMFCLKGGSFICLTTITQQQTKRKISKETVNGRFPREGKAKPLELLELDNYLNSSGFRHLNITTVAEQETELFNSYSHTYLELVNDINLK